MTKDPYTSREVKIIFGAVLGFFGLIGTGWFARIEGHMSDMAAHPVEAVHDHEKRLVALEQRVKDELVEQRMAAQIAESRAGFQAILKAEQEGLHELGAMLGAAIQGRSIPHGAKDKASDPPH